MDILNKLYSLEKLKDLFLDEGYSIKEENNDEYILEYDYTTVDEDKKDGLENQNSLNKFRLSKKIEGVELLDYIIFKSKKLFKIRDLNEDEKNELKNRIKNVIFDIIGEDNKGIFFEEYCFYYNFNLKV